MTTRIRREVSRPDGQVRTNIFEPTPGSPVGLWFMPDGLKLGQVIRMEVTYKDGETYVYTPVVEP